MRMRKKEKSRQVAPASETLCQSHECHKQRTTTRAFVCSSPPLRTIVEDEDARLAGEAVALELRLLVDVPVLGLRLGPHQLQQRAARPAARKVARRHLPRLLSVGDVKRELRRGLQRRGGGRLGNLEPKTVDHGAARGQRGGAVDGCEVHTVAARGVLAQRVDCGTEEGQSLVLVGGRATEHKPRRASKEHALEQPVISDLNVGHRHKAAA